MKNEYGKSPGWDALPDIMKQNDMYVIQMRAMEANPKWFTLKQKSHRWWHWVIHPFKTYRIRKYIKTVEKKIYEEILKNG